MQAKMYKKKNTLVGVKSVFPERRSLWSIRRIAQFPSKSIIGIPLLLVKNRVPQVHWTLQYPDHQDLFR